MTACGTVAKHPMSAMVELRPLVPFDDIDGLVHGIVSVDPPRVQCDGCGVVREGTTLNVTILTCDIRFMPSRYSRDPRRLCLACRKDAGYPR